MDSDEKVGKLLNEIRHELKSAIEQGALEKTNKSSNSSENLSPLSTTDSASDDINLLAKRFNKIAPEVIKDDLQSESYKNMKFLNITAFQTIDEDIKKMRMDLKKSYDLFTTARDTLEKISFDKVKGRIKDLHVYPTDQDVEELLKTRPIKENLDKLTKFMGEKFQEHPGEFADIPELSSFFRVCSQLEHGLSDLTKQKSSFDNLTKRILWAKDVSDVRSMKIQQMLRGESGNDTMTIIPSPQVPDSQDTKISDNKAP